MKRGLLLAAAFLCTGAAAAKPVTIQRNGSTLEFSYGWPAQAAAIPALNRHFRSAMRKALQEQRENAADERQAAQENHFPFRKHEFSMQWTTAGRTPRLLSLKGELAWDSGGAHPNSSTEALLWGRRLDRQISVESLFSRSGEFASLTRLNYCRKLDAERLKRREGQKLGGEFDKCPKRSDLAIAPVDTNRNSRFDAIDFIASPYVAGPYVEGEYSIRLPVSRRIIAALKPAYRSDFEVQRQ
jgi:Deacetylase PdaC